MIRKNLLTLLSLVGFVTLSACAAPWKVVQQSPTNPFTKSETYTVSPANTDGMQVGELAEKVYMEQIGGEEQKRWRVGKQVFSKAFAEAISANAKGLNIGVLTPVSPRHFQVYSKLYFVSPFAADKGTMVKIRVRLLQNNRTFDVLLLQYEVPTNKGAIGNRLQAAGEEFGKRIAKYLNERVR